MGLLAAEWIIQGETKYDMFAWDMARFGDWADAAFTKHGWAINTPTVSNHFERTRCGPSRTHPSDFEKQKLGRNRPELRLGTRALF